MWRCLQWRHYAPVEHGCLPHVHAVRTSTVYVYGQPACGDVFSGGTMRQLSMGVSLMSMPSVLLLSILCICTTCMWWCLQWRHYASVEHGNLPHVHAIRASTVYIMYMYNLYVVMSSVEALCVSWAWESPSCPCHPCFYCLYYVYGQPVCGDVFSGGTMRQLSSLPHVHAVRTSTVYVYVQPVCGDVFSGGTMRQLSMGISLMSMPSVLLLSMYMYNLYVVMSSVEALCASWTWVSPSCPCRPCIYCLYYVYNLYAVMSSVEALCASWTWVSPSCPCRPCFYCLYYVYNLYVVMSSVEALCASWAWEYPSCPCRPCFYCLCICTTCMWRCLQWRHYAPVEHGSLPHVHAVRASSGRTDGRTRPGLTTTRMGCPGQLQGQRSYHRPNIAQVGHNHYSFRASGNTIVLTSHRSVTLTIASGRAVIPSC